MEREQLACPDRLRAPGAGHPFELDYRDGLLLTMIWLRQYPAGEVLGYFFGVSEPTVRRAVKRVLSALEAAGRATFRWPDRKKGRSLPEILEDCPEVAMVISFNDDAAFGAICAARELGREGDVVIVGQGADRIVRKEIRHPESRLVGSTAYWPEKYCKELIQVATKILNGEPVPPAVYNQHVFITQENIDEFYPESSTTEGVLG